MSKRLTRILEQEKSAYKNAKRQLKSLKKRAKKSEVTADEALDELKSARTTLAEAIDLVATREFGDSTTRADIVVDGDPVLQDVPVRFLVVLEKHIKRLRKAVWEVPDLSQHPELDAIAARADKLYHAVRMARQEANLKHIDEVEVADSILDYVFEGEGIRDKR